MLRSDQRFHSAVNELQELMATTNARTQHDSAAPALLSSMVDVPFLPVDGALASEALAASPVVPTSMQRRRQPPSSAPRQSVPASIAPPVLMPLTRSNSAKLASEVPQQDALHQARAGTAGAAVADQQAPRSFVTRRELRSLSRPSSSTSSSGAAVAALHDETSPQSRESHASSSPSWSARQPPHHDEAVSRSASRSVGPHPADADAPGASRPTSSASSHTAGDGFDATVAGQLKEEAERHRAALNDAVAARLRAREERRLVRDRLREAKARDAEATAAEAASADSPPPLMSTAPPADATPGAEAALDDASSLQTAPPPPPQRPPSPPPPSPEELHRRELAAIKAEADARRLQRLRDEHAAAERDAAAALERRRILDVVRDVAWDEEFARADVAKAAVAAWRVLLQCFALLTPALDIVQQQQRAARTPIAQAEHDGFAALQRGHIEALSCVAFDAIVACAETEHARLRNAHIERRVAIVCEDTEAAARDVIAAAWEDEVDAAAASFGTAVDATIARELWRVVNAEADARMALEADEREAVLIVRDGATSSRSWVARRAQQVDAARREADAFYRQAFADVTELELAQRVLLRREETAIATQLQQDERQERAAAEEADMARRRAEVEQAIREAQLFAQHATPDATADVEYKQQPAQRRPAAKGAAAKGVKPTGKPVAKPAAKPARR